jgi:hypothetical protein
MSPAVFRSSLIRILAGTPIILTEGTRGIPQSLQEISWIVA